MTNYTVEVVLKFFMQYEKRKEDMRTLYIDIYFLINFTVDLLALYFSAALTKVPTTTRRLICSAVLCAFFAVCIVLTPEINILKITLSCISFFVISWISIKKVSLKRRVKYFLGFIVFEALIGGAFSFIWSLLDKYIYGLIRNSGGSTVNRKMLFFSLIILVSIGVFRMLVSFFSNIESDGACKIEIEFLGKSYTTEAFIDSGNLALDPMDMRPVLFLKKEIAKKILPEAVTELYDPDLLDREIRKRIRLIPISKFGATHVLTGVRVDKVNVVVDDKGDKKEEISVIVAIDKEEGTYGGYYALVPSCALKDVLFK